MKNCLKTTVELLSPAGDMDSLKAAVNNGCDAVYIGGKHFSARQNAENFDEPGFARAIDYAHLRGVKAYVAVNTLYKDNELNALAQFCAGAYRAGADAFIVQDIGAAALIRNAFDIELHASTQLTVRTADDAAFLKRFGFRRFILARETALDEIKRISAGGIETEVFVHGALCYCHSGQCLMSAYIGGRSGNRGNCAQPCRLLYELVKHPDKNRDAAAHIATGYLLSPKDMLTLDSIPEIIDAGVTALKIEGRMKSPQYVALATKAYRQAIDRAAGAQDSADYTAELAQVFSRGGTFCTGYYKTHSSPDMLSVSQKSSGILVGQVVKYIPQMKTCVIQLSGSLAGGDGIEIYSDEHTGAYFNATTEAGPGELVSILLSNASHKQGDAGEPKPGDTVYKNYDKRLDDRLKALVAAETRKLTIFATVEAKSDRRLRFTLAYNGISVSEYGETVARASKTPTTRERLLTQLSKTGGTPFMVAFQNCDVDDGIYIDIKGINEVRRRAVAEMERRIIDSFKRSDSNIRDYSAIFAQQSSDGFAGYTVLVSTREQAELAIRYQPERVYLAYTPENSAELEQLVAQADGNVKLFAALPAYERTSADRIKRWEASGIDGYLIRTYGQLQTWLSIGGTKPVALDYSLQVMNAAAFAQLSEFASTVCLSPELMSRERLNLCKAEAVVYGRLRLMTTNLCPVGIAAGKGNGKHCRMRGQTDGHALIGHGDMSFPVVCDCEACVAHILSPPVSREPGAEQYRRIDFTTETLAECERILSTLPLNRS